MTTLQGVMFLASLIYIANAVIVRLAVYAVIRESWLRRGRSHAAIHAVALIGGALWPLVLIYVAALLATTKLKELIRR